MTSPSKKRSQEDAAKALKMPRHAPFSLKSWLGKGLSCPTCLGRQLGVVDSDGGSRLIVCEGCDGVFPVLHDSPHMLDVRMLLALPETDFAAFERSQINALPEYRSNSAASVSLVSRDDVRQVMDHMALDGASVLDLGSGVFTPPGYLMGKGARSIIGIDPLAPEHPAGFDLVGGFAEYLPFADASFDVVTSITSTDHFIDMDNALREIRRVLKPHGRCYIWNEFTTDPDKIKPATSIQRMARTIVSPQGDAVGRYAANIAALAERRARIPSDWRETELVDPFHSQHLGRADFVAKLVANGLAITHDHPIRYPNGGVNNLLVVVKAEESAPQEKQPAQSQFDQVAAQLAALLESGLKANAQGLVSEMRAVLAHQKGDFEKSFAARSQTQGDAISGKLATLIESGLQANAQGLVSEMRAILAAQQKDSDKSSSARSIAQQDAMTAQLATLIDTGLRANAEGLVSEMRAVLAHQQGEFEKRFATLAAAQKSVAADIEAQLSAKLPEAISQIKTAIRKDGQSGAAPVMAELARISEQQNQQRMFGIDQGVYLERIISGVHSSVHEQVRTVHERLEAMQAAQAQQLARGDFWSRLSRAFRRIGGTLVLPLLPLIWLAKFVLRPFVRFGRKVRRVFGYAFSAEHALLRGSVLRALFRPTPRAKPERRRILMLTISMIEIDPRINKIAKSLVEAGWQVDILCQQPTVVDEFLTYENVAPGIRYIRVKWGPEYVSHWIYYQHIFLRAARELEFDYVHVNDMTTLLTGWLISRNRGKPLTYDAHEMWSENVEWDGKAYVGMSKKTRRIARLFEGFMLRFTDNFYSVSPSILNEYERRHGRRPKMLANSPDIDTLDKDVSAVPSVRELAGIGPDKFVTIYLGGLGPLRNIDAVVEAHKHLDDRFVFVIRGPDAHIWGEKNLEYARSLGVEDRIRVLPGVGRDDILAGMKGADCGVVLLRNICKNFYWFYPNKFFEYALGGIAVVVSNFPDVTAHIEREKNGVTVDPHDPEDIARGLRYLADHPEETREMGRRGRESILREHNWRAAVQVMVDDYEALWKRGRGEA